MAPMSASPRMSFTERMSASSSVIDHPQSGGWAVWAASGEKLRTGGEHRAARHGAEQHEQRRGQGGKAASPAQTAERGQGGNAAVRQLRTEPEKQSGKHGERTEYGDARKQSRGRRRSGQAPCRKQSPRRQRRSEVPAHKKGYPCSPSLIKNSCQGI